MFVTIIMIIGLIVYISGYSTSGIASICAWSSRIWRSIRVVYIRPYKIQFLCLISRSCSSKYSEYFISNFATRNIMSQRVTAHAVSARRRFATQNVNGRHVARDRPRRDWHGCIPSLRDVTLSWNVLTQHCINIR